MANFCYYEIHAKGPKDRVYALGAMMPVYEDIAILRKSGTDKDYTLWFKGDCKWALDAYCDEKPGVVFDESDDEEIVPGKSYGVFIDYCYDYQKFNDEYMYLTMRQKSEILQIEVFAMSIDEGGGFVCFDHYKNGKQITSIDILNAFNAEGESLSDEAIRSACEDMLREFPKAFDVLPPNIAKKYEKLNIQRPLSEEEQKAKQNLKEKEDALKDAKAVEPSLIGGLDAYMSEREKKMRNELASLERKLDNAVKAETTKLEKEIAKTESNINDKKTSLDNLGFLQLSKKKELRLAIEEEEKTLERLKTDIQRPDNDGIRSTKQAIDKKKNEIKAFGSSKNAIITKIKEACSVYVERLGYYYDYKNADPENRPALMSSEPVPGLKSKVKAEVQSVLSFTYHETIKEMQESNPSLADYSSQYLAGILRQFIEDGVAEKESAGGKTYFSGTGKSPSNKNTNSKKTVINDVGWNINQKPLAPTLESIVSDTTPYKKRSAQTGSQTDIVRGLIIEFLAKNRGSLYTLDEIQRNCDALWPFSTKYLSSIINSLAQSGKVVIERPGYQTKVRIK